MSREWDNQPNRQRALETTIPTLSGIMLGLIGALFVAAAITDVDFLKGSIEVSPLIVCDKWGFTIPGQRRSLVLLLCVFVGLFFYRSIVHCVWSQMSFYDPANSASNPDVIKVSGTASPEELRDWKAIQHKWDQERKRHSARALLFFNIGISLLFLPLVFLLPSQFLVLGFYVWLGSLVVFYRNWSRQ